MDEEVVILGCAGLCGYDEELQELVNLPLLTVTVTGNGGNDGGKPDCLTAKNENSPCRRRRLQRICGGLEERSFILVAAFSNAVIQEYVRNPFGFVEKDALQFLLTYACTERFAGGLPCSIPDADAPTI